MDNQLIEELRLRGFMEDITVEALFAKLPKHLITKRYAYNEDTDVNSPVLMELVILCKEIHVVVVYAEKSDSVSMIDTKGYPSNPTGVEGVDLLEALVRMYILLDRQNKDPNYYLVLPDGCKIKEDSK